ncbi:puromycin-sensitive aminopeptidase [Reticulomyxa filosa]|uniref:Puromycin-sensitive aminopeptidase n=1 Tax=Reticulomyxa filosa TaxID=46433 RepID=X6L9J1_RETFI|nr:puromycin-sensitive aminopeptidase [Reticulomyxa filosa]|eukprot:ETN98717.1 puromycin-sensitive aminopeptidase [Reticulomyxa filosa]
MLVVCVCKISNEEKQSGDNKSNIPSSLRSVVYAIAVKNGGKDEFYALKKYYLTVQDSTEKQWALRSLGAVKDPELIQSLLEWLKESDDVRIQDKVFPFRVVANSQIGREISWNYLQKTFEQWYKIFEGGFLVQHLAKIPSEFISFQKAAEVEKFYSTLDFPACKRSMDQCVENIKKNAKWREQEIGTIEKWVNAQIKFMAS